MIAIQARKEEECDGCFKTKRVYVLKINGTSQRTVCKGCRDKLIDKWFEAKEDSTTKISG
jgi:hypothetical protein